MRAIVLLLAAQPFFWLGPWQLHQRHHHRPQTPDCAQINAAKKEMTPERYERALRLATPAEQKIIIDCEARL